MTSVATTASDDRGAAAARRDRRTARTGARRATIRKPTLFDEQRCRRLVAADDREERDDVPRRAHPRRPLRTSGCARACAHAADDQQQRADDEPGGDERRERARARPSGRESSGTPGRATRTTTPSSRSSAPKTASLSFIRNPRIRARRAATGVARAGTATGTRRSARRASARPRERETSLGDADGLHRGAEVGVATWP